MARGQFRGWKILGWMLGVVALLIGAVALWIRAVEARRWREMEGEIRKLLTEVKSRDSARPVLYGDVVPGNGWDDYFQGTTGARRYAGSWTVIGNFLHRHPKADPEKVREIVAGAGALFDHLHRGAHRTTAVTPPVWERGRLNSIPSPGEVDLLMSLAICRARFLADSGQAGEAVHLLLDVCQFANDSSTIELLWVWSTCFHILEDLRRTVVSKPLDRGRLEELERALDRLDRSFPGAETAKVQLLKKGMWFLQPEGGHVDDLPLQQRWRFGFSLRIMQADAFQAWSREAARSGIGETASWSEVRREAEAFQDRCRVERNGLVGTAFGIDSSMIKRLRERRAQIRLLRAAARFRATGELLDLEDPFGHRLPYFRDGDELTIWSVGADGIDDGGDDAGWGTWIPQPPVPGKPAYIPGDIVLRVRR